MSNHSQYTNVRDHESCKEVRSIFEDYSSTDSTTCKYYTENEFVSELARHRSLSFMHINIASLSRHFESFNHLLSCLHNLNIIGISETRIKKENAKSSNFEIQGYSLLFINRGCSRRYSTLHIRQTL